MALRTASELTTRRIGGQGADEIPVSEILLNGRGVGRRVPGAVLEAAVKWRDCYLLFMTDDVPFEDSLGIQMLDGHLDILDSARIGGPYATGAFSSLELEEPNSVRFRFAGDTIWKVELLERPEFRMPFLRDAPGVTRPLGFSRRFVIRGSPRPQTA